MLYARVPRSIRAGAAAALIASSTLVAVPPAYAASGTVEGSVFRDLNADGAWDTDGSDGFSEPAQAGIQVRVYDAAGGVAGPSVSDAAGAYSVDASTLVGTELRVEFTIPGSLSFLEAGPDGVDSGPAVQFVTDATPATANFSVLDPEQYCQADPEVAVTCFVAGNADVAADGLYRDYDSVVSFDYTPTFDQDTFNSGPPPTTTTNDMADIAMWSLDNETGSVWGLAFRKRSQQLIASQFTKKYTPYLADDPAAIVVATPTVDPSTTQTPPVNHSVIVSSPTVNAGPARAVTNYETDPTWDAVGKTSWADIELSGDETTLYGVNLFDRRLYEMDLGTDASVALAAGDITSFPMPDPGTTANVGCAPHPDNAPGGADPGGYNRNLRPGGLGYHDGQLYVTLTCTAEAIADGWPDALDTWANDNTLYVDEGQNPDHGFDPAADALARRVHMRGYVYRWDGGSSFTQVANFPLDYTRGCSSRAGGGDCSAGDPWQPGGHDGGASEPDQDDNLADWLPWAPTPTFWEDRADQGGDQTQYGQVYYPQPWLSDVDFPDDGGLVVSVMDRFGHQSGNDNNPSEPAGQNEGVSAGDILRFGLPSSGVYPVENNGTAAGIGTGEAGTNQGPGGGEFFYRERYRWFATNATAGHQELTLGSTVLKPGTGEVLATVFDPEAAFRAGGVHWYETATGDIARDPGNANNNTNAKTIGIYGPDQVATFGKVAGLGDMALVCDAAPVQIGDRVWLDLNSDGVQDPGEPGIENATVTLLDAGGTPVSPAVSTTTDASGRWTLPIDHDTAYQVQITLPGAIPGVTGTIMLSPDGTAADGIDSDATEPSAGDYRIAVAPHAPGENDHSLDAGFFERRPQRLGNLVFDDLDNDGTYEPGDGETPLAGIEVELWADVVTGGPFDSGADTFVGQTFTDAGGLYYFTDLDSGDYFVVIPDEADWDSGAAGSLANLTSSTGQATDLTTDNDDNGAPQTGYAAVSQSIPLDQNTDQPTGETGESTPPPGPATLDTDSNLTIDFGFFRAHALGNLVWHDENNDGVRDVGEPVFSGVAVELLDGAGAPFSIPVTTLTNADGFYVFDGLAAGDYTVEISASNFDPGEVLDGYRSSTLPVTPTDATPNDTDHGTPVGAPGTAVQSPVINLAAGAEPTGEAEGTSPAIAAADADADLTVDFGFWTPASIGNDVWYDGTAATADGLQPGDPVPGVTVTLKDGTGADAVDADGNVVAAQVTDDGTGPLAAGQYLFTNLVPGDYFVVFTAPTGTEFTILNANGNSDETVDSDADPDDLTNPGRTATTTLSSGEVDVTWDAGLTIDASISIVKSVADPDTGAYVDANTTPVLHLAGGTATYQFVIENTGSTDLIDVSIDDDTTPGCDVAAVNVGPDNVLTPGEIITLTAQCTATVSSAFTNTATVTGTPSDGTTPLETALGLPGGTIDDVTDSDPAMVAPVTPDITLDKSPNSQTIAAGALTASFTIEVTNTSTGIPELENILLTDSATHESPASGCDTLTGPGLTDTDSDGRLDAGETWTYTCDIDRPAGGWPTTWDNTATVVGEVPDTDPSGNPLPTPPSDPTDNDTVDVVTSALTIVKEVSEAGAGSYSASETVLLGDDVDWRVIITNAGASTLGSVVMTDDSCTLSGPGATDTGTAGELSPGESWTYTCTTTANADVTNTATVTATPTSGGGAIGPIPASADVTVVQPHLSVLLEVADPLNAGQWLDADTIGGTEGTNTGRIGVLDAGGTAEFRVTLCNESLGGLTLTGATVDITMPDTSVVTIPATSLTDGACETSTSADVAGLAYGPVTTANSGTATAVAAASGSTLAAENFGPVLTSDGIEDANDTDPATIAVADIVLLKEVSVDGGTTWFDADDADLPHPQALEGDELRFRITLTNPGEVQLAPTVTDTPTTPTCAPGPFAGDTDSDGRLDPGETWVSTCTDAVGPTGVPSVRNVADVDATPVDDSDTTIGTDVSDANEANVDLVEPASLGDRIWLDANADGDQAGDANLLLTGTDVVTVQLLDDAGVPIPGRSLTTQDGTYAFTGLWPGDYYVQFTLPSGYLFSPQDNVSGDDIVDSDPAVGGATPGRTGVINLAEGEDDPTIDAGVYLPARIGDTIWLDTNGDGVLNGLEGPLVGPSVTVTLLDDTMTPIPGATVVTTDGTYEFTGLTPGDYYVVFTLPAGYDPSPQNQGVDDDVDSDGAVGGLTPGRSPVINLTSGEDDPTIDQGVYLPASVGDTIFLDNDANGTDDGADAPATGVSVTVNLLDVTLAVVDTVTTTDGTYAFTGLRPGTYTVEFAPVTGYEFSPQGGSDPLASGTDSDGAVGGATPGRTGSFVLASGDDRPEVDQGIYETTGLGDFVWEDLNGNGQQDTGEDGVDGVTVNLLDGAGGFIDTVDTTGGGAYQFTGLLPGADYQVEFVLPAGWAFTEPNAAGVPDVDDSDAVPTAPLTARSQVVSLVGGSFDPTLDAGVIGGASLGDTVWFDGASATADAVDTGESGVDGVTVTVYDDATDAPVATDVFGAAYTSTQVTSGGGTYLFTGLAPGSYYVVFTAPDGTTFTGQNAGADDAVDSDADATGATAPVTLESNGSNLTLDAGIVVDAAVTVEKQVADPDDGSTWYPADTLDGESGVGSGTIAHLLGSDATFRFVVTNTGTTSLTNVVIADPTVPGCDGTVDLSGVGGFLAVGATVTHAPAGCTATLSGAVTNTGDVTADPADSSGTPLSTTLGVPVPPVTDSDPASVDVIDPSISIDKTPDAQSIAPDASEVAFTLTVTNTSTNVAELTSVVVTDTPDVGSCTPTFISGDTDADDNLDVGESWLYDCVVTLGVGETWPTSWDNLAAVTAVVPPTAPDGSPLPDAGPVTDEDIAAVTIADITIVREVRDRDTGAGTPGPWLPTVIVPTGDDVDWLITSTNTGDTTLENVTFTDDTCAVLNGVSTDLVFFLYTEGGAPIAGDTGGDGLLTMSPGETWQFTCGTDGLTGPVTATVDVVGDPVGGGSPVTGSASAEADVLLPHLSVQLEVYDPFVAAWVDADADAGTEGDNAGGIATLDADQAAEFRVTVCNPDAAGPGNGIDLTDVTVDVTLPGAAPFTIDVASLLSGECLTVAPTDDPRLTVAAPASGGTATVVAAAGGSNLGTEPFGPVDSTDGIDDDNDVDSAAVQVAGVTLKTFVSDSAAGPFLDAQDTGAPQEALPGAPLTYVIEVTNVGDAPLGNVVVVTDVAGCTVGAPSGVGAGSGVLPPGEVWTYSCTVADGYDVDTRLDGSVTADPLDGAAVDAAPVQARDEANVELLPLASLGDTVWLDVNENGIQDPGEPGVADVTVRLYDGGGNLVATTTTDADGGYLFSDVLPGTYFVEFVAPTGLLFTVADAGADDATDSDALPATGRTAMIDLAPGDAIRTVDAGLFAPPPEINLSIDKVLTSTEIQNGGTIRWRLVVSNVGAVADPGPIVVSDALEPQLTFVAAAGDGWTCALEGATVNCVRAAGLASGDFAPEILLDTAVTASAGSVLTNRAEVLSTQAETDVSDNADVASGPVTDPGTLPETGADAWRLLLLAMLSLVGGTWVLRSSPVPARRST